MSQETFHLIIDIVVAIAALYYRMKYRRANQTILTRLDEIVSKFDSGDDQDRVIRKQAELIKNLTE